MGRSFPDNSLRSEFLPLADEPGCLVCRAAHAAVDRFFAWYRIEQYHEPSIIQYMQEARGFCLEHTRQFVGISSPHLVSTVYEDLLAAAAKLLRSAGRESSALPAMLADRLRPKVACLVCKHQEAAVDRITRRLPVGLTDSQVRAAILRPSALCLPHFVHLLPSLDWGAAQLLAPAQLASLEAALAEYDTGADSTELVRLLVGANSDETFLAPPERASMVSTADTQAADSMRARDARGAMGRDSLPTERSSWSPAIAHVEALLNASGCPLCREEEATAATYLRWLSQELSERMPFQAADDICWLCRSHLWRFIWTGDDKAVGGLLRSIYAYWIGMVQALISGLDRPPSTSFVARCWHGMVNARQRMPRVTNWRALWEGLAEGRRSRTKRLAELRGPVVQTRLCPACRFQRERADRLADLLDRALGDAGIARCYEETSGVCFRHLPLAIRCCTDPSNVRLMLRTQYTRVAVVHWELEEYWRKLNWTHRWEPRGDEQAAWHRAVAQYTGTDETFFERRRVDQ
jgi:hypothetical protein